FLAVTTLLGFFVGPWAAVLIMTTVVGVQALVFQDGGLAALGANVFNMGILTAFVGYAIFRGTVTVARGSRTAMLGGAFAAAWITVMISAFATSAQLAISGTSPWGVVLPAMMGVHALIGLGEGVITAGAVGLVLSARPDLLRVPTAIAPAPSYSTYTGESA
ncbi:MAG TPA: energy-coupling factor ABC transporter permease, partial [Thermomicrobiales bacterium]|nr:energy-coupling factor ABC transporter permease [Thermomicrobiales bacterium]